jgi:Cytochrome P450
MATCIHSWCVVVPQTARVLEQICDHAGMQPISVLAPYLPTKLHRQRDEARKQIGAIFKDIIQKRRASGVKGNDILQTFIDGRYERAYGGRPLNESEITGLLIAALFAGMHTSTITSSWTGLFLASNRTAWDACVEEQKRIIAEHGKDLTVDILGKMEVLHACITEALRMYPPLIMMLRYARQPFTVTGMACSHFPPSQPKSSWPLAAVRCDIMSSFLGRSFTSASHLQDLMPYGSSDSMWWPAKRPANCMMRLGVTWGHNSSGPRVMTQP